MKQILWWMSVLGIPIAALSLVSLVQRLFDVGINDSLAGLVNFYRAYARLLVGALPDLIQLRAPPYVYDVWAISCLLGSIQLRATVQTEAAKPDKAPPSMIAYAGAAAFLIFLTYSFLGLLFGLYSIVSSLSMLTVPGSLSRISTPEHDMRKYTAWLLGSLAAALIGTVAFYALNAAAPNLGS